MTSSLDFRSVYERLLEQHGPQDWWPADTPFEIMVGAILTQNTAWTNVEKAILNLKEANALALEVLLESPLEQIASWIRPSGYYNLKARRLQSFCQWLAHGGGIDNLRSIDTNRLRVELLSVYGIGPETADDILLYALDRPVFVVDAYTRRILSRIGLVDGDEKYETLRLILEDDLDGDVNLYAEYHALIVSHGKDICRNKPRCDRCLMAVDCPGSLVT